MQAPVYANLSTLELTDTLDGGSVTWPLITAGSDITLKLRLSQNLDGGSAEIHREVVSLKASIGQPDQRPLGGMVKLQVGDALPVDGVNVTDYLSFNATAEQMAQAINKLSGLGDLLPCQVVLVDEAYRIRFTDASVQVTLECEENNLWPVSKVDVYAVEIDEGWTHELRFTQTPLAETSSFGLIVPQAPQVVSLQHGGENTGVVWNEVQKLTISPEFRGAFQLKRGFRRTQPIGIPASGDDILEKLEALADEDGAFVVTEEQGALLIEFTGSMGGVAQALLEVHVFDPPPGDLMFTLPTATAELWQRMRKVDRSGEVKLPLEITLTVEDEQYPDRHRRLVFRDEVTFTRPVSWEDNNVSPNIEWNQPPARRRYIPYSPTQILIGQRNYRAPFGDGASQSFTFNHNLGTEDLHVTVRENLSGGIRVPDDQYAVSYDNENAITLTFNDVVDEAEFVVLITTADFPATFQPHTHHMGDVDGLDAQLSNIGERLTELESLVPTGALTLPSKDKEKPIAEWTLPPFREVYPTRAAIEYKDELAMIDLSQVRTSGLLPAVHVVDTEALPLPLPANPDEAELGKVYENVSDQVIDLDGGLGRRAVRLQPGEHATVLSHGDRTSWYRVAQANAAESSWYPTDFERELFMLSVNDKQLRVGTRLELNFGLEAAIFKSNTKAQWTVVVEWGAYVSATAPATPGANLQRIEWSADPLLEQVIDLTSVPCSHVFGVKIAHVMSQGSPKILASRNLYGAEETSASKPSAARFALRGRLIRFDTEDNQADPRGLVAVLGLDRSAVSGSDDGGNVGKASILRI